MSSYIRPGSLSLFFVNPWVTEKSKNLKYRMAFLSSPKKQEKKSNSAIKRIMTKSWLDLFETRASRLPASLSEGIFHIDEDGNLDLATPDKEGEHKFRKTIVNFFVEYFYMDEKVHLKDFMDSLERAILIKMLSKFNGNQRNTAKFLGLNHTTLNQKIKRHNIRFRKTAISE